MFMFPLKNVACKGLRLKQNWEKGTCGQMRPMNPLGDPRSYHRWSIWRPMDSLGLSRKCFGMKVERRFHKWTDITCPVCLNKMRTPFGPFWPFLIGCMVSADYWLADYPEVRRTTQPSIIGGPLGEPGFCIFCSTVWGVFGRISEEQTHVNSLWPSDATGIWVIIGSGNGLVP